jgi:hypothetical protein
LPSDTSDRGFLIAHAGHDYYVDDGSNDGDFFTPGAVGDNAQSGKSPTTPMASLAALLAAYDLDPGDVIHVDTGTYHLLKNVLIDEQDRGVRIEGPASGQAILNRSHTGTSSYVIELVGADDVELDHLWLTGGYTGIHAGSAGSDRLRVTNSTIYANYQYVRMTSIKASISAAPMPCWRGTPSTTVAARGSTSLAPARRSAATPSTPTAPDSP